MNTSVFYNSKAKPKQIFGVNTDEYKAFYKALHKLAGGALQIMDIINSSWDKKSLCHSWRLPDNHISSCPVETTSKKRIEVDELDHKTFAFVYTENKPSNTGISLPANLIQSIDGYIVREMVTMAHKQGIQLATIHDAFGASPAHMNQIRQNYVDILLSIAKSSLFETILNDISGSSCNMLNNPSIIEEIKLAEYALS